MKGHTLYQGRYTIEEEISKGGFATIFRANEEGRPKPVAIKLSKTDDDPGYSKALLAEAKIIRRLKHRNIVSILPIPRKGQADIYHARATHLNGNPYFFVMEYLGGGTLADYLEHVGTLTPAEAAAVALEVARALDHMHRVGYAHNDLKLENIVFRDPIKAGEPYSPVLIDFGIATRIQQPDALSLYITPPEQIKRLKLMTPPELDDSVDRTKVDVWGLGVVLYCMLGGKLPFTGREKRITERIVNSRPTSLNKLSSQLPDTWDELIIDGCLAKDPQNRLSLVDLGRELRPESEGAVAGADGRPPKKSRWSKLFASRNLGV